MIKVKRLHYWSLIIIMVSWLSCIGSGGIVILLPGQFKGQPMVLAETSYSEVSINNGKVVPSKIIKIWWNDHFIVTQNYLAIDRKKYPGDTIKEVDTSTTIYYLIDLENSSTLNFESLGELNDAVAELGISIDKDMFMSLSEAQKVREKELGFNFTAVSVNEYLHANE